MSDNSPVRPLPMFLTFKQLRENVVSWNRDTIRKRVEEDGFPAIKDEKGMLLFPRDQVLDWFKRRTVRAG